MRTVNDYWMVRNPDYGTNQWDRATYYSGLVPLFSALRQQHYYEYAVNWATKHNWGLNEGTSTRSADNHCAGQAYIQLYEIEPAAQRISAISESMRRIVTSTKIDDWWWCDALHMAPPVMAALGKIKSDNAYYTKLNAMWNDIKIRRKLWDATDHLWFRDAGYLPPKLTPGGKHIYWSRGNGWVFAGLAKILSILPQTAPGRDDYVTMFREMAGSLKALQRTDGFWNSSLVDPTHYGGPEASGTAFFTYGMAWGIANGYLTDTIYLPTVVKAWNALNTVAVHPDGMLGYCQSIAAGPGPSAYGDTKDYAVGAFVLAGCELLKIAPGSFPDTANIAAGAVSGYSSQQAGNPAAAAVDGSILTRWSAQGYPQWIELDLRSEKTLKGIELHFIENRAYRYTLQTKRNVLDSYATVIDSTDNTTGGKHIISLPPTTARFIRLTITGASGYTGDLISICDWRVYGGDLTSVEPRPSRPATKVKIAISAGGPIMVTTQTVPSGTQLTYSLHSLAGERIIENTVSPGGDGRIMIQFSAKSGNRRITPGMYLVRYRLFSGDGTNVTGNQRLLIPAAR